MSSTHYSEDDLALYYYGDGRFRVRGPHRRRARRAVEHHLEECATCAALYREISSILAMIEASDVPGRSDQYGLEVWQRIRHRLPERDVPWFMRWLRWDRLALAGAVAALVLAAFVAGLTWRPEGIQSARGPGLKSDVGGTSAPGTAQGQAAIAAGNDARQRILLTSVADHLDQSARVLTDIMNAPDRNDISAEQRWAEDLLSTSRLYRQDAADAGEQSVAGVLDELERSLLEIVHSPSKATAANLEQIRHRIDAAALLFKVRVMSDELRRREESSATSSTTKTS